jgi:GTP pyrophosphokinase
MTSGLVIHHTECLHASRHIAREPDKWVNVAWGEGLNRNFDCRIRIMVHEEKGILARVTTEISQSDANIIHVAMSKADDHFTQFQFTIQVEDKTHLDNLLRRVRHVPGVTQVEREHT